MSDTESSGAVTPAAETVQTPSAPTKPELPTSTFSNNRGSGLARGKRPASPPAPAATPSEAEYKPTAVSIVTAPAEYKNPFAPPAPAEAPASPEATPAAEAAANPAGETPAAEVPTAARVTAEPTEGEAEVKPELKILPPETPKRVEHSWESQSFRNVAGRTQGDQPHEPEAPFAGGPARRDDRRDDRRGERPVFRPERERRSERPAEFHGGRGDENPTDTAVEAKKSGGLFGWVKKIFGGPAAQPESPAAEARDQREPGRDGPQRRRRHRGGRGRHFRGESSGPREGQPGGQFSGEPRGQGGNHHHGGRRRRRHRGGGGGYRGDSRREGGPPGGS